MPAYKNAFFDELDKPDEDETDPNVEDTKDPDPANTNEPPQNETSGNWEKRYGDLRRHSQQQTNEFQRQIADLQNQIKEAAQGQIKFPKTKEEVAEWSKKYPDVADIVTTIAQMKATEAAEKTESRMADLAQVEARITQRQALEELQTLHPDFEEIRADKAFHDWVEDQPAYIQDALYRNNTDARSAARAIDLYKADKGISKKSEADAAREAARENGKGTGTPPSSDTKPKWSESKVDALSARDFEKHEDEIMEAMRSGKFIYDLSGK